MKDKAKPSRQIISLLRGIFIHLKEINTDAQEQQIKMDLILKGQGEILKILGPAQDEQREFNEQTQRRLQSLERITAQ